MSIKASSPPLPQIDEWLQDYAKRVAALRSAYVLRQYQYVGYHANQYINEYLAHITSLPQWNINEGHISSPVSSKTGAIDDMKTISNLDSLVSSNHEFDPPRDLLDPYYIRELKCLPYKPNIDKKPLAPHKSHPLPEDHPFLQCITYCIVVIQQLYEIPTSPQQPLHMTASYRFKQNSPQEQQAYIGYVIGQFLCNIFGTWVHVNPAVLLSVLKQFLVTNPVLSYLITFHMLSLSSDGVINDELFPQKRRNNPNFIATKQYFIRNIQYRRDLYLILIQSLIVSLRLRFHVIYAPGVYPSHNLTEQSVSSPLLLPFNEVSISAEENVFIKVFFDASSSQVDLLNEELLKYSPPISPDEVEDDIPTNHPHNHIDDEKSLYYPYIPTHLQQHLSSILGLIDVYQDPMALAKPGKPYDTLRLLVTGIYSLSPINPPGYCSSTFITRPKPIEENAANPLIISNTDNVSSPLSTTRHLSKSIFSSRNDSDDDIDDVIEDDNDITESLKAAEAVANSLRSLLDPTNDDHEYSSDNEKPYKEQTNNIESTTDDVVESSVQTTFPLTDEVDNTSTARTVLSYCVLLGAGALARHRLFAIFKKIISSFLKRTELLTYLRYLSSGFQNILYILFSR